MPHSDANEALTPDTSARRLAVLAEVLYLSNLLILPGIAFLWLLSLYLKHRNSAVPLARCHLSQTLRASIWAGLLLVIVSVAVFALGGFSSGYTWMVVILYVTTCHTTLVLLGMIGLAKAMAGRNFRYPLIGTACDEEVGS
ncbi:hypothetical protein BOW53_01125 [Solemya pervernicosa gill symbiont]|uniref:Cytochrome C oxidase subunit III n=2 Tax=Gammaproteobacteria incertae sedis TaxID=118884 RepID=A0A1T2LAU5_9GAMM|nr:hypothetical protein [Candidatus Reidiella endopervernicosa]OOZ42211.1 hypothetical protein BOW53_01125 [Solemya pervernicosa gill symbiont]QKQ27223.1 hypothetical protein HUE57_13715 [Candidatus Reidiella endopervernicosa]